MNSKRILILMVAVFGFSSSCLPTAAAAPAECMVVGYTFDGASHYSLARDEALMVGTVMTIDTTCPGVFDIRLDGTSVAWGNGSGGISIPQGIHTVEVIGEGWSEEWSNLTVFGGVQVGQSLASSPDLGIDWVRVSSDELLGQELLVAFGTGLIVWALVTVVLWRLVNGWVDRTLCEEVSG
jgi:hypothetical protein